MPILAFINENQLICSFLLLVFSFVSIRIVLSGVATLYLRKNDIKERKKGQTLKEWFWYSRYKEEIPDILFYLYYIVIVIHPVNLSLVIIAMQIEPMQLFTASLIKIIMVFDLLWGWIISFLSWKPGVQGAYYEQWISRLPPNKNKKKRK